MATTDEGFPYRDIGFAFGEYNGDGWFHVEVEFEDGAPPIAFEMERDELIAFRDLLSYLLESTVGEE